MCANFLSVETTSRKVRDCCPKNVKLQDVSQNILTKCEICLDVGRHHFQLLLKYHVNTVDLLKALSEHG
jgi:hypothetical protein